MGFNGPYFRPVLWPLPCRTANNSPSFTAIKL